MGLQLDRLEGQEIITNGPVTIKVLKARNGRTKLKFDAEPEVRIDRMEIYERRQREGGEAA